MYADLPVPVVVKEVDGTCMVSFPDGTALAAVNMSQAEEIVNYYFTSDEPKRRIGFVLS